MMRSVIDEKRRRHRRARSAEAEDVKRCWRLCRKMMRRDDVATRYARYSIPLLLYAVVENCHAMPAMLIAFSHFSVYFLPSLHGTEEAQCGGGAQEASHAAPDAV